MTAPKHRHRPQTSKTNTDLKQQISSDGSGKIHRHTRADAEALPRSTDPPDVGNCHISVKFLPIPHGSAKFLSNFCQLSGKNQHNQTQTSRQINAFPLGHPKSHPIVKPQTQRDPFEGGWVLGTRIPKGALPRKLNVYMS